MAAGIAAYAQIPFSAKEGLLAYKASLSVEQQPRLRFYAAYTSSFLPTSGKAEMWGYYLMLPNFQGQQNPDDSVLYIKASHSDTGWHFIPTLVGYELRSTGYAAKGDSAFQWIDSDSLMLLTIHDSTKPTIYMKKVSALASFDAAIVASPSNNPRWHFFVRSGAIAYTIPANNHSMDTVHYHTIDTNILLSPSLVFAEQSVARDEFNLRIHREGELDRAFCSSSQTLVWVRIPWWDNSYTWENDTEEFRDLRIYNIFGTTVHSSLQKETHYKISSWAEGMYILRFHTNHNLQFLHFFVQH